jgi:hypothetical protein
VCMCAYVPPASQSPSGLNDIACQAVLLIGSLNLCTGSSSCSRMYSLWTTVIGGGAGSEG